MNPDFSDFSGGPQLPITPVEREVGMNVRLRVYDHLSRPRVARPSARRRARGVKLAIVTLTLVAATSFGIAALLVFDGGWLFYVAVVGTTAALALTVALDAGRETPASASSD